MPPKVPSLAEMRERLKLQQAINRELEKTARLEERIARAKSSRRTPSPKSKPTGKRGKKSAALGKLRKKPAKSHRTRLQKVRRPSKSRTFEAKHPRGPGGRFLRKVEAQAETPRAIRRWALFLRPAYGKKAYPNEVLVLILDQDPAKMKDSERGAWVRAVRQARHKEDSRVRWIQEQGSGVWLDPTVEPGTWWVERRENLN